MITKKQGCLVKDEDAFIQNLDNAVIASVCDVLINVVYFIRHMENEGIIPNIPMYTYIYTIIYYPRKI